MKVLEMENDKSILNVLEQAKENHQNLSGVIVLELCKDGAPQISTSNMRNVDKAFLIQFLNAWAGQYFMGKI